MLELRSISVAYGPITAVHSLNIQVQPGEIVALIGANGAGKSTTLNAISGLVPLLHGEIHLNGERIDTLAPHTIVQRGIVQVPEGRRVFGRMSVLENLEMGGYTCQGRVKRQEGIDRAFALFPRLAERRQQPARTLSGGEQQMLAMARALMSKPAIVLLDEPSMGLAPLLVERIFSIISEIHRNGTTIVLVEQNAAMALAIANRAYVLETGSLVMSGDARELSRDAEIRKAYLGEG